MTSAIITTQINENFPVAGTNQSSQGFRTNFLNIKNALLTAKTEISNLQSKYIIVNGDAIGTSGIFDSSSGGTMLSLTLSSTGIAAGTYNTATQSLALTVDTKGRITGITATSLPTYSSSGTYGITLSNATIDSGLESQAGTYTISSPVYTVNTYGQITSVSYNTLDGFGLLGLPLVKGGILVGSSSSTSTIQEPSISDGYILTSDSSSSTGLSWKELIVNSGTLTGILAGNGISVDSVTIPSTPTIDLDINSLSLYDSAGMVDESWTVPFYNSNNNTVQKISINGLHKNLSYLTSLYDDTSPQLSSNLDLNNYYLYNSTGTGIKINSGSNYIYLNNDKWPNVHGIANQVLSTDGNNNLFWTNHILSGTVTSLNTGIGLKTDTGSAITSTGTISLDFSLLSTETSPIANDYIPVYNSSTNNYSKILATSFVEQYTGTVSALNTGTGLKTDTGSAITSTGTISLDFSRFNTLTVPNIGDFIITYNTSGSYNKITNTNYLSYIQSFIKEQYTGTVTSLSVGTGLKSNSGSSITSTGTISLDFFSLSTSNSTISNDYIPIYNSNSGNYSRILGTYFDYYFNNCIFVSTSGNDTTGNGSINKPYLTISNALNTISSANTTLKTIIITPGTYSENISLNKPNTNLKGFGVSDQVILTGTLTISQSLTKSVIENITFDMTSQNLSKTYVSISTTLGVDELILNNCNILRTFANDGTTYSVMNLGGIGTLIEINNCKINGHVVNSFNGYLSINNLISNSTYTMYLITNNSTNVTVTNSNKIGYVQHLGGILELNNISSFSPDYTNKYAIHSITSGNDYLIIKNTSLRQYVSGSYVYYLINKTGTSKYLFANIDRSYLDSISGSRIDYAGSSTIDIGDPVITSSISSTYICDISNSLIYDLTLTTDTTITITASDILSRTYGRNISVLLRQNVTGNHSVTFSADSTIIWDNATSQPSISTDPGKITLFTFFKVGSTWMGGRAIFEV